MSIIHGIVIPPGPTEPVRLLHLEDNEDSLNVLEELREAVGGDIEGVLLKNIIMYINGDRKPIGLSYNDRATDLYWSGRPEAAGVDMIVGNAVILGKPDRNGNDTSAPQYLLELAA